jgi:hypothetical protein
MTQPAFADQVTALTAALQAVEARLSSSELPREALAGLKSSVDDLRLRLWGALSTGSADDYRVFQERFRLRRASEICEYIESELSTGLMNPRHEELKRLGQAATALGQRIDELSRGSKA